MTLFKQMFIGVSILFFVLLAGVEAIDLASSRKHLQNQLAANAQEVATILALRLGTLGELEDLALIEAVVSPVFDRGYFQEIRVLSVSGETLVRKVLAPSQSDVPEWFTRAFPLGCTRRPVAGEFRMARAWPGGRGELPGLRIPAAVANGIADHRVAHSSIRSGNRSHHGVPGDAVAAPEGHRAVCGRDRRTGLQDDLLGSERTRTRPGGGRAERHVGKNQAGDHGRIGTR